ncbi:MAG: AAA family ATPase, partial [Desulfofundulus sp.]
TMIIGDNGQGKSSIGECVVFALYGTTINGSSRCDNLIRQGAKKARVKITVALDDGTVRTITRVRSTRKTELALDDVEVSQAEVNRVLGMDAQTFLAMYNPLYLLCLAESEPNKARQFFTELCVPPSREDVLARLWPNEVELLSGLDLHNPDEVIAEYKREMKVLEDKEQYINGQMEEVRRVISEEPGQPVVAGEELEAVESRLAEIKNRLADINNSLPEKPTQPVLVDINVLQEKMISLRGEYKRLQKLIKPIPSPPEAGQRCRMCGQVLPANLLRQAMTSWEKEAEQVRLANADIEERLKEIAAEGQQLKKKLAQAHKENVLLQMTYQKALSDWDRETAEIRAEITRLNQEAALLEKKLVEAYLAVENARRRKQAVLHLEELEKELTGVQSEYDRKTEILKALMTYRTHWTELMAEQVTRYLDHVSLLLFDTVKTTGEIKPVFRLTFDSKPTPYLSLSERIRAGLELTRMVCALRGVNVPVFIDNTESITHIDEALLAERQVIMARVVAGEGLQIKPVPSISEEAKDKRMSA